MWRDLTPIPVAATEAVTKHLRYESTHEYALFVLHCILLHDYDLAKAIAPSALGYTFII
jgi:hypothetical protein